MNLQQNPRVLRKVRWQFVSLALLAGISLSACMSPSSDNGIGGSGQVDSSLADVSIGKIAGASSGGDTTAVLGMLNPRGKSGWAERIVKFFEIERSAYALGFAACTTTQNWDPPGTNSIVFNPTTGCTISYPNGTQGSYNVTGTWTFTFSAGATVSPGGAVSNNPAGTTVTRTATTTTVTRSYTGPLGHTFAVTSNTTTCTPYTGSIACGGDIATCVIPGCPYLSRTNGVRNIDILGMQITGTRDGITTYDHTVTSTSPIVITGYGPNRIVNSGTVVVYHNIAHVTTTTTINGPLTHMANCAFPVSGSVTTTVSGGPNNGKTETVTFTSTCGQAALTRVDGSTVRLQLHVVL